MALWKTSPIFVAASLLVVGCGGLSDDDRLGDLELEDVTALCEETLGDPFTPTREQVCALSAHFNPLVTNEQECQTAVDECLAQEEEETEEEDFDCTDVDTFPAGCDATVGDARACGRSAADGLRAVYDRASCSNIETDRITADDLVFDDAACAAINDPSCR